MKSFLSIRWLSLVILLAMGTTAQAYEFIPTNSEFASWPRHCQARYVTTDIGRQQSWSAGYPQSVIDQAIADIGWETFEKLHHYCAGIIWLNRSKMETDPAQKKLDLRTARAEVLFTFQAMNKAHPLAATIVVTLAQICRANEDYECAVTSLQQAIEQHPDSPEPYSALAVVYRDKKQLSAARDVLLSGDTATDGKSPEINYNLGLILIDLQDYEGAIEHAKRAYALGHPLPGLKRRLVKLGKWPTTE